jgi:argininosuccinate synthase
VYEAPAAAVLHLAHADLEGFVSPRDLQRVKQEMAARYADMVYDGAWYSRVREAMDAFVATVQERVTGQLRVKLFKGSAHVVGRRSPFALYDHGLATYGEGDTFDHGAAAGFIKLHGLPIETAARRRGPGSDPAGSGKAD